MASTLHFNKGNRKPLCGNSGTRNGYSTFNPAEVECKRCLAGLAKRAAKKAAKRHEGKGLSTREAFFAALSEMRRSGGRS